MGGSLEAWRVRGWSRWGSGNATRPTSYWRKEIVSERELLRESRSFGLPEGTVASVRPRGAPDAQAQRHLGARKTRGRAFWSARKKPRSAGFFRGR